MIPVTEKTVRRAVEILNLCGHRGASDWELLESHLPVDSPIEAATVFSATAGVMFLPFEAQAVAEKQWFEGVLGE